MSVGSLNTLDSTAAYPAKPLIVTKETNNSAETNTSDVNNETAISVKINGHETANSQKNKSDENNILSEELDVLTKTINKFMESLTADLRFTVHDRTHRLIVQMVDTKSNTVIKEFPPKKFLDMIANITDCVGAILDKKV